MKKLVLLTTTMTLACVAVAAPRPAYDTGSTEFYYSKAQAGYTWSQVSNGQSEEAGPQTLLFNGSYPVNELVFVQGGYRRASLDNSLGSLRTETTTQTFTVGGGARFPIAMDVDFNVGASYNWQSINTTTTAGNGTLSVTNPTTHFAAFKTGLLMTLPDTGLYTAANFALGLQETTQTTIGAELGFRPSDQFSVAAIGEFDTDFTTTTLGIVGNLHF